MITHTLSIVKNTDQILVVADGKIGESGTYDTLLAKKGKYAAMWNAEQMMDEPFKSLDPGLRSEMLVNFLEILENEKVCIKRSSLELIWGLQRLK